jgi:hypothetical protein
MLDPKWKSQKSAAEELNLVPTHDNQSRAAIMKGWDAHDSTTSSLQVIAHLLSLERCP